MSKIKVLWHSDSSVATHSGFASVSLNILQRLSKNDKLSIAELGLANPPGTAYHTEPNWKIYHSGREQWAEDVFIPTVLDFKPDVVVSLLDCHMSMFINDVDKVPLEIRNTFKGIAHLPIDGAPFPSYWAIPLTGWDAIACIHPFGERTLRECFSKRIDKVKGELKELFLYQSVSKDQEELELIQNEINLRQLYYQSFVNSINNMTTICHGANQDVYKPVSAERKRELRQQFLIPYDWFVFCFIGRNSPRKMQATLLKAYKEALRKYPKTFLLLGCAKKDFGWPMDMLVDEYEIPANNILILDNSVYAGEGFTDEQIANMYQMSDCFVSAAYGGGFELCHLESMLCGLPQIGVKGAGSITDMVKDHGILVPAKTWNLGGPTGDCERPLVESHVLADAMKNMIKDEKGRKKWSDASLQYANQEHFTWDYAAKQFEELIDKTMQQASVAVRSA